MREKDERVKELVEIALRLEGLARHASTHAAGVVISPRPLTEIVPLYKSNKDEVTTQYDMNALERIGLLKMDFLGLTTLTVLDDAVRMIRQNRVAEVRSLHSGARRQRSLRMNSSLVEIRPVFFSLNPMGCATS